MFYQMVKRVSIDICEFLSFAMGLLFLYFKMIPFVKAAYLLKYVNGQTVCYLLFTLLLVTLPVVLLSFFRRVDKRNILRWIFYAFGVVIITGTISDIIEYNWFIDYTYIDGDAVFVNLMWNMPNSSGLIFSLLIAIMYFVLGKQIKRNRRISYSVLLAIFLLSNIAPVLYSLFSTGTFPRETYLQKSLYVAVIQIFTMAAFTIAATSRSLWQKHIWN